MRTLAIQAVGMFLILVASARAVDEFKVYGDKSGYDEQLLRNYLSLSENRHVFDLAGEWTITYENFQTKISVPSNYDYEGKVVYRRSFVPGPEFENLHFRLVSFGINFAAEIRINGEFVANHNGGYLRREIDLSDGLIKVGETNTIEITVNSAINAHNSIPRRSSLLQPKTYGGIFREIFLLATPKLTIDKWSVRYTISNDLRKCDFTIGLDLRNYDFGYQQKDTSAGASILEKTSEVRYVIEMFNEDDPEPVYTNRYKRYRNVWEIPKIKELNPDGRIVLNRFANLETNFTLEKPIFWNAESPYRYRIVFSLIQADTLVDQTQTYVGLSKVSVQDNVILINSQPLTLRGVEYYEDYPDEGNSLSFAVMELDVLRIKKMGANVVYFKHHPPHPYFLELCNRYGLFILYEAPAFGFTPNVLRDNAYAEELKPYYRTMIENDRLNPCILAWGLGSAHDHNSKDMNAYLNQMSQLIRSLDDRPTFCTSIFGMQDVYLDQVDIINLSLRSNDFLEANIFATKSLSRWPNRAVICTYGVQIFPNNQNGYSDPTSTKFQAKYLIDIYKKLSEWKVAGGIIRSYNDYVTNRTYGFAYPLYDQDIYTSGLVTYQRKERFAYDFAKALYSNDKIESIPIGSFENPFPKTFPVVGLLLVLVFVTFYRQSGKFNNSVFRSITKVLTFYTDVRENRVIAIWPALIVAFLSSLSMASMMSLIFFELRRNQLFDQFVANVLVDNGFKAWIDNIAWSPEIFITSFTALFFLFFIVTGLLIKLFTYVFRVQVYFQQTFLAGLWSSSHYLFLMPCVILFQRLMRIDFFMTLAVIICVIMAAWHVIRIFRILKIIYNVSWNKILIIFGGLLIAIIAIISIRYSRNHDMFNLMEYSEKIYQSRNYSFD